MFGTAQRRAKAGVKAAKLHSIAAVMRGRKFEGSFDSGGVGYRFSYQPVKATITGRKLELIGNLTVNAGGANGRVPSRNLQNVKATLISTQGGIGAAPPRKKLPPDPATPRADLPVVESTGSLSFCGVLYFKLAPLESRALGVPGDMSRLQLNVRLAPRNEAERALQGAYSSIVDALYGKQADASEAAVAAGELNKLLAEN
jgi:hypothetical protein